MLFTIHKSLSHNAGTWAGADNWESHVCKQRTNIQAFLIGEWERGGPHFSLMPWPWWTQQRQEADSYLDQCTGNEHRKPIKKWLALWLQCHVMNSQFWFKKKANNWLRSILTFNVIVVFVRFTALVERDMNCTWYTISKSNQICINTQPYHLLWHLLN